MKRHSMYALVRYAAVVGNLLFLLWILYNGIDSGFSGTSIERLSFISLAVLLLLNMWLLFRLKGTKRL